MSGYDDLAERIGRLSTEDMLVRDRFESRQVETGGLLAARMTLDAVSAFVSEDDFAELVDLVRDLVAVHEEMAA